MISNRIFGLLILIAWICILLIKPISNKIDDMTTPQPWFDAEIRVFKSDGYQVEYTRWINRRLKAKPWNAWVEFPNDNGVWQKACSGSGSDTYDPSNTGTVVFTVEYFVNPTQPCKLKSLPVFKVCAKWSMYDDYDRFKPFGANCSPVFKN